MVSKDIIEIKRKAIFGPLMDWIKQKGVWKVSGYTGISVRKLNNIVYHTEFNNRIFLDEFFLILAAKEEDKRLNKSQNIGSIGIHKTQRFRLKHK